MIRAPDRGIVAAVVIAAVAFVSLYASIFRINAPDLGWHLMNGAHMAEHRVFHFADPFSHTSEGRSYPPTQWLFELGAYALHSTFGITGVIVAKAMLVAALFLVLGRLLLREGAGPAWAALLLLVGIHLARFRFIVRPDLVTFLFVAIVLSVLYDFRRRRHDRLRFLPLLFFIWVQFHSGALFGLLLLGATWLGEELTARVWPRPGALGRRERNRLLLWTLIGAACTLVNPNHLRFATFAVGHVEDFGKFAIRELRPLLWEEHRSIIIYMIASVAGLVAAFRRDPAAIPVVLAVAFATTRSVRLFPLYLVVSLPLLAAALRPFREVRSVVAAGAFGAFLLAGHGVRTFGPWGDGDLYQLGFGVNDRLLPVAGADALERIDPGGNLFNSNLYGGYLIWRFDGERPVFTDGRSQLHEPTLEFASTHRWPEIVERYRIGHALFDYRWGADGVLPGEEMVLVWWDDLSLLFVDREEALARDIPFYEIRHPVADRAALFGADREKVADDLARAAREAPRAVLPRRLLAGLLGATGGWTQAESSLREALAITPWNDAVRVDHGIALARLGHADEALDALERGLTEEGENAEGWGWLGNVRYEKGDRRGAEKAFRRAMNLAPQSPAFGLALGRMYEREGDREQAAALYRELAERFPGDDAVRERLEGIDR